MTTKRARQIVAVLDNFEDVEPEIFEDRLYEQTARKAKCEREDVSIALCVVNELEAANE